TGSASCWLRWSALCFSECFLSRERFTNGSSCSFGNGLDLRASAIEAGPAQREPRSPNGGLSSAREPARLYLSAPGLGRGDDLPRATAAWPSGDNGIGETRSRCCRSPPPACPRAGDRRTGATAG